MNIRTWQFRNDTWNQNMFQGMRPLNDPKPEFNIPSTSEVFRAIPNGRCIQQSGCIFWKAPLDNLSAYAERWLKYELYPQSTGKLQGTIVRESPSWEGQYTILNLVAEFK